MSQHLHIVTLDVPYPADYGGAIEQFYKIVWLHKLGIKIHLHCFTKDRIEATELNKYCESVTYYQRLVGIKGFSPVTPYIVSSRRQKELLSNLMQDDYPILFEGIHTTYFLQANLLVNRKILVRLHNVEYIYYNNLAAIEKKFFKRLYFKFEAHYLKRYEKKIATKYHLLAASKEDESIYKTQLKATQVEFIPAFTQWENVTSKTGTGSYCLYHGNLSINENEKAALWLLQNVFNDEAVPFIIAGKQPSKQLIKKVNQYKNIQLIPDPNEEKMQELIANAQINILPSFNSTGIKLKLLNALFTGRYCIANSSALKGSNLESICITAESAEQYKTKIKEIFTTNFTEEEIKKRATLLSQYYNNLANAKKIVQLITS